MWKRPIRRPSPALVVACIALLISLGGTGYATVLQVPRSSVGTLQLQRNAVKAAKIAPNAVRTGHVLDGSLLSADFKAGQVPQGPKGDKGAKGDKGDKGDPATRLFGAVTSPGTLAFGEGVTAASRSAAGNYSVTFNRDLTRCVVIASSGQSQPVGGSNSVDLYATYVSVDSSNPTRADVRTGNVGAFKDNGFVIAAFC